MSHAGAGQDRGQGLIGLILLRAGALGWLMVGVGVWLMVDSANISSMYGEVSRWPRLLGILMAASGAATFARTAGRCFPLASVRARAACEMLPWVILVGVLLEGRL